MIVCTIVYAQIQGLTEQHHLERRKASPTDGTKAHILIYVWNASKLFELISKSSEI